MLVSPTRKSLCTNPVSYKATWVDHSGRDGRGRWWMGGCWLGAERGLGEKEKGASTWEDTDFPNGEVPKACQKRGHGAHDRSGLYPPGHRVGGFGTCIHPLLAQGESVTPSKPLVRSAPFQTPMRNIVWYHLYAESQKNDTNELIYKTDSQT